MQNPTYYISVDIEGMSGFGAGSGTEFDQILLREHITATAAGLKDGGAGRLQVKSFHGMPNGLPEYLEQIPSTSWDDPDLPSIASDCKGLILLGFHGLEPECAFGHSYHHPYLMLNGERVGEITVQIYLAASKGIPTILIAGDGHAVLEANRICGSIGSVNIRKGIKKNEGDMDRRILAGIREAALLAAQSSVPIPKLPSHFCLEIPMRSRKAAILLERAGYGPRRNGNQVSYEASGFGDIYRFLTDSFKASIEAATAG